MKPDDRDDAAAMMVVFALLLIVIGVGASFFMFMSRAASF
jgi:hypothetical protein